MHVYVAHSKSLEKAHTLVQNVTLMKTKLDSSSIWVSFSAMLFACSLGRNSLLGNFLKMLSEHIL